MVMEWDSLYYMLQGVPTFTIARGVNFAIWFEQFEASNFKVGSVEREGSDLEQCTERESSVTLNVGDGRYVTVAMSQSQSGCATKVHRHPRFKQVFYMYA